MLSKMKTVLILCVLTVAAYALPQEHYTDRYDTVNLDEILNNKRLLLPYIKCLLDQGKCAPDGKELKSHIQEALETYCAKCTKTQEAGTRRVIAYLINNEPDYWRQLSAKYDREGKYAAKYESELRTIKA